MDLQHLFPVCPFQLGIHLRRSSELLLWFHMMTKTVMTKTSAHSGMDLTAKPLSCSVIQSCRRFRRLGGSVLLNLYRDTTPAQFGLAGVGKHYPVSVAEHITCWELLVPPSTRATVGGSFRAHVREDSASLAGNQVLPSPAECLYPAHAPPRVLRHGLTARRAIEFRVLHFLYDHGKGKAGNYQRLRPETYGLRLL